MRSTSSAWTSGTKVRDVTVLAVDAQHMTRIVDSVRRLDGIEVEQVSDRTFLLHLGGKLEIVAKAPLKTRDDLSMAYTPGVARVSRAIAADPADVWNLTIKQNTVAVVSDGTAVLGLGDVGPEAALPVMEGKAVLFKEFGGVDAFPICLDTKDTDEIVRTVRALAPVFGGINLEDIASPRCFEIERRLRETLDIPVFHDDQHGTAIVVLAGLLNATRVVGKRLEALRVVVAGAGAAGIAVTKTLLAAGVRDVVVCDRDGVVHERRTNLDAVKRELAAITNPRGLVGLGGRGARGRRCLPRARGSGCSERGRDPDDGAGRDRLRDGEPDPRGAAGRDRRRRRGRGHGPLRLSEPDQQRARLPRRVPRRARRARLDDQQGDGARRGTRDRRGGGTRAPCR